MADGTGWEMFIFKRTRHTTEQGVELEARRPQKMLFLGKLEEKPDKFYTVPYLISHVTNNLTARYLEFESNFQRSLLHPRQHPRHAHHSPDPRERDEN